MLGSFVSPQGWSENYAILDGATCTYSDRNSQIPVPALIDGDLETVGRSGHRIVVILPTRKPIHRVVIRGTNIEDLILYAGVGGEGEWRRVKQLKNNRESTIDLRVGVLTDRIRLVVGGTSDDRRVAGAYSVEHGGITGQVKRGYPVAQEIEIYGLAAKRTQKAEEIGGEDTPASTAETENIEEETPEF